MAQLANASERGANARRAGQGRSLRSASSRPRSAQRVLRAQMRQYRCHRFRCTTQGGLQRPERCTSRPPRSSLALHRSIASLHGSPALPPPTGNSIITLRAPQARSSRPRTAATSTLCERRRRVIQGTRLRASAWPYRCHRSARRWAYYAAMADCSRCGQPLAGTEGQDYEVSDLEVVLCEDCRGHRWANDPYAAGGDDFTGEPNPSRTRCVVCSQWFDPVVDTANVCPKCLDDLA
jgi:Zn finger protein HypA/HybF involved in hydrogenase expression